MQNHYSISQARRRLGAIVQEAEQNGPVQITRRGKTVAAIVSQAHYEQLTARRVTQEQAAPPRIDFAEAYRAFRASLESEDIEIDPEIFNVRVRSPGREINFDEDL